MNRHTQAMREPTIFDAEKGLAKPQYKLEGSPWADGYPTRAGKPGTKVSLRYVWLDVHEEPGTFNKSMGNDPC